MPRRSWVVSLLVVAALAGCGSGNKQGSLTSRQQRSLIAQLEAVRTSASALNVAGTASGLRRFRASVARLHRSGALSDQAARLLRIGAARVLARVKADSAPAPAPPTPTPTPTPAPPPKAPKEHGPKHQPPGQAKKHGKGGEGD